MGEVLDDVEAMVRRSGDGDDVARDVDADVAADVEATGLQLLNIGWKVGACGVLLQDGAFLQQGADGCEGDSFQPVSF